VLASDPTITQAQEALRERGIYRGHVTGIADSATRSAIRDFQRANSLNENGYVGPLTKQRLLTPPNNITAEAKPPSKSIADGEVKTPTFSDVTSAAPDLSNNVFPPHGDSLEEIAAFAEKICSQSLSGNETATTITAKLNGDFNGLAKALGISVGVGGLVKKDGTHYEGIPKEKLPDSVPTPAQCKLEVVKVLIEERQRLAAGRLATDRPNHSDALAQIAAFMTKVDTTLGGDTLYSISNLRYANGYQEDVSHYIVVAAYQREFKVGLRDISNATIDKKPNPDNIAGVIATGVLLWKYGEFSAGDSFDEARRFRFMQTENGWILANSSDDPDILAKHHKPKASSLPH
jgi:hypothetical protein